MKEKLPQRKNIRLKNYDYSKDGLYFITICIKDRISLLGKITIDNEMQLSEEGKVVEQSIKQLEEIYDNIKIDEYVIMPNHIHLIILITNKKDITISKIINKYKGGVTKKLGYPIWQKLFYDHIIRNEKEYLKIKEYVINNVVNWNKDECYF